MRRVSCIIVFLSLTRVALAGSVEPTLRIGSADGIPGDEVTVTVELDAGAAGTVLELFNEITWNSSTPVRKLSNGQPDCFADIRVVPNFASFTCTNESCVSLRAEVRSQGEPLADGPVYGCIFVIDPDTPAGDYLLDGSAAMWGDADRQARAASIEDGLIRVTPTPTPTATPTAPVAIGVRTNDAVRGTNARLQFDFTDSTGRAVDTGFDIVVEDAVFDLALIGSQCRLDGRLTNHLLTVLSLGNEDVPFGFRRIRLHVFPDLRTKPVQTILNGPLMSCTVPVRANAPLGASPIDLQQVFAVDSDGSVIPGIVGLDGFLVVTTDTPTGTPTATPTLPPTIPCVGDCDENGVADIYEAILSIRIALEKEDLATCEVIDANHDGCATADELVMAVGSILNGCPQAGRR